MFRQVRKVTIDELIFDFESLDIEFEVNLKNDLNSDSAKVYIYNLSKETLEKIKRDQGIVIEAGYRDNTGIIFSGTVDNIETRREENDFKTTITATPSNNLFTNTLINIQFNTGVTAKDILKKLESISPYKIKILEIPKNPVYKKGKAFSSRLSEVIKVLCADMKAEGVFEKNTIVIKAPNKNYTSSVKLGSINGLISIDKQEGKDGKKSYTLQNFIIPQITLNQALEIDSEYLPGNYIVRELKYLAKDINTFTINAVLDEVK